MRESTLLQHVYASNAALPATVTLPPGDDMGAFRLGGQTVLVTVDQLADATHFNLATATIEQVGRKAITRNLSDVAAMAAKPVGAVVAVSLPRDFGEARATRLFDAMRATAAAFDCPLMGGDIAMWPHPLLISVTVFAEPAGVEPVLRRGSVAGDGIYVTGRIGGSSENVEGYTHHLDFTPRIEVARKLASDARTRPHAMIDLSDGMARDLGHLCKAAGLRAHVDAARLPIAPGAHELSKKTGHPAWRHAVGDGEDYELLFTAPMGAIPAEVDGVLITCVGTMQPREGEDEPAIRLELPGGSVADLTDVGWEHHA